MNTNETMYLGLEDYSNYKKILSLYFYLQCSSPLFLLHLHVHIKRQKLDLHVN